MLSDILKMIVTNEEIIITKANACYVIQCEVRRLIAEKKFLQGRLLIDESDLNEFVVIIIENDILTAKCGSIKFTQFFPHDIQRCIIKDLNKGRSFDLDYRKHLVYDYSREHYSLVMPYEVSEKTVEKAKEIVKRHSTGKNNKPTGIVLDFKLIVVKGDSTYQYDL
jgi:hypothetical protein